MTNASRAQVDLDALARDLRQEKGQAPQASGKGDPLAELARIVGQDRPNGLDERRPRPSGLSIRCINKS